MTYLNMAAVMSLNCSMMDAPSGSFGCGVFKIHVAGHPDVALGVQREGADADAGAEGFHFGRIIGGETDDGVR